MDNCGGQNKNQMVISLFVMMAKLGCYQIINLIFLVSGHTKKSYGRMFMLLKQRFHHKNVYAMKQLHENLNLNEDVELKIVSQDQYT